LFAGSTCASFAGIKTEIAAMNGTIQTELAIAIPMTSRTGPAFPRITIAPSRAGTSMSDDGLASAVTSAVAAAKGSEGSDGFDDTVISF
jgi:hypothetical protein